MEKGYEVFVTFVEIEEDQAAAAAAENARIRSQAKFLGGSIDEDNSDAYQVVAIMPNRQDMHDIVDAVVNPLIYNVVVSMCDIEYIQPEKPSNV